MTTSRRGDLIPLLLLALIAALGALAAIQGMAL